MPSGAAHSTTDGRTLRAERTRAAVVEAHLELLDEGNLRPTVEEVAQRAGVSSRSVFQHFEDREALFAAVSARQAERIAPLRRALRTDGPFEERLEAFLDQRVAVLEFVTPVRRAALLDEPFSQVAADSLAAIRRLGAEEARAVFAPELARAPEPDATATALVAITSWSAWEAMRRHERRSVEEARSALRRAIRALLA